MNYLSRNFTLIKKLSKRSPDRGYLILLLFFILCWTFSSAMAETKIIIATNGAAGKLIEHTLPAVTLAATKDIDYIELHTVVTSDNELIVFRDLTLNRLTDVADIFPDRSREDGNYYVIDFTLQEIRQIRLKNVFETGWLALSLAIPSLKEELSLIRRLESILEKQIGVVLEIKSPWFHLNTGKDISMLSLDILKNYNYTDRNSKLFIQCFDPDELQRIHDKLLPEKGLDLPLIQLIEGNDGTETQQKSLGKFIPYNYDWLFTNSGLRIVSSYAAAITLPTNKIVDLDGNLLLTRYISAVQENGVAVFAYALNNQPDDLPPFADTFSSLINFYLEKVGVNGFYTDSFDQVRTIIDRLELEKQKRAELPKFFSSLNLSPPTPSAVKEVEKTP